MIGLSSVNDVVDSLVISKWLVVVVSTVEVATVVSSESNLKPAA